MTLSESLQQCDLWKVASASPWCLLEMQILRPHPWTAEIRNAESGPSNLCFNQLCQYVCYLLNWERSVFEQLFALQWLCFQISKRDVVLPWKKLTVSWVILGIGSSTGILCFIAFGFMIHYGFGFFFLQIKGLWQSSIEQVYQSYFPNSICCLCVSVPYLVILALLQIFYYPHICYDDLWSVIFFFFFLSF